MHKHGDLVDVEVYLGVRHDQIEEVFAGGVSHLAKGDPTLFSREMVEGRNKADNSTVGVNLGNLLGRRTKQWGIIAEPGINPVCSEIIELIRRYAEPYFAQLRTTDDFLAKLVRDDRDASRWAPVRHYRAMNAVAAAYVLRDRPMFDRIRSEKEHFLVDRKDEFGLQQYRPFANYLAEHWDDGQKDDQER
jgi:hypothetical protein